MRKKRGGNGMRFPPWSWMVGNVLRCVFLMLMMIHLEVSVASHHTTMSKNPRTVFICLLIFSPCSDATAIYRWFWLYRKKGPMQVFLENSRRRKINEKIIAVVGLFFLVTMGAKPSLPGNDFRGKRGILSVLGNWWERNVAGNQATTTDKKRTCSVLLANPSSGKKEFLLIPKLYCSK